MATTVIKAFDEFLEYKVNLDNQENKTAKSSKGWLIDNIRAFDQSEAFFMLYPDIDLNYGSFSRKTKIRPLDDIDLMIGIHAQGNNYVQIQGENVYVLNVPETAVYQLPYRNADNTLNSRRVVNAFKNKLGSIPQYKKADIVRDGAACVLNLTSYPWSFDIVPCFFTAPEWNGRQYYLIPDGNGNWKKTDPRIDQARVSEINQKHNGNVLKIIRLVKYWNRRPTMPSMGSYLLESLILNYYQNKIITASVYPDIELAEVLTYIANQVIFAVADPKGIVYNINDLSGDDQSVIRTRALSDAAKCKVARDYEKNNQMQASINKWREIFGDEFPKYE